MVIKFNSGMIASILILTFMTIEVTSCAGRSVVEIANEGKSGANTVATSVMDACQDWEERYQALDDSQKNDLRIYGLVSHGNGDKSGEYVISPNVINDCAARLQVGRYLRHVSQGEVTSDDREFVSRNSALVVKALQSVWKAPDLKERNLFFIQKEIRDQDMEPFLSELLKANDYNTDLMYATIERPIPALRPSLLFVLQRERRNKNIPRQIYVLIALQKIADNSEYLSQLRSFAKDERIPQSARSGIVQIIKKFESHQSVSYSDVEALGLEVED